MLIEGGRKKNNNMPVLKATASVGVELWAEERGGEREGDGIDALTHKGYVIVMQTAVYAALSGTLGWRREGGGWVGEETHTLEFVDMEGEKRDKRQYKKRLHP